VKDSIAAFESSSQGGDVAKVTDNVLNLRVSKSTEIGVAPAKNANGTPFVEKCDGEIGADETCTAGNEDVSQVQNPKD
jgi:hypothetical protein